jgi:hypothetical protein
MKSRFATAFFTNSLFVTMITGFFWAPLTRVYERAGYQGPVPFVPLLYGIGLTMIAMQTTATPEVVFLALFLNAVSVSVSGSILSQQLFKHMKQETGAVGVIRLVVAVVFLMMFFIGWVTQRYELPYKEIWGIQLLLFPAACIALHYLMQYFRVQEEQKWKECRNELMQPVVKLIRPGARSGCVYESFFYH